MQTHDYTIFSIDDSRDRLTKETRRILSEAGWNEVETECISAYRGDELEGEIQRRGIPITNSDLTRGEVAIWYTTLNGIEHAPIVTLEDDAIIDEMSIEAFDIALSELPEDADFFSLFIPRDSDHMFNQDYFIGKNRVCKTYQVYGGVSMYFTPQGVDRIMDLVHNDGIFAQWDNQFYQYAKEGKLNGYTSMPSTKDIVWISGQEPTTVHNTERFGG